MKIYRLTIGILLVIASFTIIFSSCNKDENDKTGFITFGTNYNIINCITTVTIYVDNTNIGTLKNYTDTIYDCGEESNITKELSVGEHSYKIEIRPENGTGCMKDITDSFIIKKNECKKIFIDYRILWNE